MQIFIEYKRHKLHINNNQTGQADNNFFGGDTRIASSVVIVISSSIILFAWLFPAEKKSGGMYMAMLFVSNINIYFLMPVITALKNENIRTYIKNRQICFPLSNETDQLDSDANRSAWKTIGKNQVNPV